MYAGMGTHPINLRLVGVSERREVVSVLLVFGVEMVNDFCELRNFLAHLVVQVGEQILVGGGCHGCDGVPFLRRAGVERSSRMCPLLRGAARGNSGTAAVRGRGGPLAEAPRA